MFVLNGSTLSKQPVLVNALNVTFLFTLRLLDPNPEMKYLHLVLHSWSMLELILQYRLHLMSGTVSSSAELLSLQ